MGIFSYRGVCRCNFNFNGIGRLITMSILRKNSEDNWADGVMGGLGRHLGIDPLVFRISFLIAWLGFDQGWLFWAYIVAMILIPEDQ